MLDTWQGLPLAQREEVPNGVEAPEMVAVLMDGGRLQIRLEQAEAAADADAQPEPGQPEVPVPAASLA